MPTEQPLCARKWDLLDPSPEDVTYARTHQCLLVEGHKEPCRCRCGSRIKRVIERPRLVCGERLGDR